MELYAVYLRDSGYGKTIDEQLEGIYSVYPEMKNSKVLKYIESNTSSVFNELLEDSKNNKFTTLVTDSLDRLDLVVPSVKDFFDFIKQLSDAGIRFVTSVDRLDSKMPANVFIPTAIDSLQSAGRVIQGERIHLGLKMAKDEGRNIGRTRSADYEKICEMKAKGFSTYEIATELDISRGTVQHCLRLEK